jgi:twitching motility protein PilT
MHDRESARWTLTAAETGHLVFSTLHTRDVRGSVAHLLDMFLPNQQEEVASQLSLGLSHIISQKLVPRADGQGRVVAMEVLNNSMAVQNLIRTGKVEQLYSQLQIRARDVSDERMMTMEQSLALLASRGTITPQEGERWANHPAEYISALRYLQAPPGPGSRPRTRTDQHENA